MSTPISTCTHAPEMEWALPASILGHSETGPLPFSLDIPDGDEEDDLFYKPLSRVTLAELEAHLLWRGQQLAREMEPYHALKALHARALQAGVSQEEIVLDALANAASMNPEGA